MTIIFAAALAESAAIGADSVGHDASNLKVAQRSRKVRRVNSRVAVAKAGYGGQEAEPIWDALKSHPDADDLSAAEVAALLRTIVPPVYDHCRTIADDNDLDDAGIYLLVVGVSSNGESSIFWLNFKDNDFGGRVGPFCVAFGPSADAQAAATDILQGLMTNNECGPSIPIDAWSIDVAKWGRNLAPHAIGFPVDVEILEPSGLGVSRELSESDPVSPDMIRQVI